MMELIPTCATALCALLSGQDAYLNTGAVFFEVCGAGERSRSAMVGALNEMGFEGQTGVADAGRLFLAGYALSNSDLAPYIEFEINDSRFEARSQGACKMRLPRFYGAPEGVLDERLIKEAIAAAREALPEPQETIGGLIATLDAGSARIMPEIHIVRAATERADVTFTLTRAASEITLALSWIHHAEEP